jgi:hypothetical protein
VRSVIILNQGHQQDQYELQWILTCSTIYILAAPESEIEWRVLSIHPTGRGFSTVLPVSERNTESLHIIYGREQVPESHLSFDAFGCMARLTDWHDCW